MLATSSNGGAACRADARWGRRSRNASHSPARQRRWRRAAAHPLSGSPEASAHVQVQRKYGWELSNRVCRARGAAAHACAPGLSTGRRLMPMPARCGAAAPCRGAATVRRSPHTRRVLRRVLLGRGCLCGAHRARATASTTKRLHAWTCEGRTKTRGNPDRGMRVLLGRVVGLLLGTVRRPTERAPEPGRQKKADNAHA